MYLRNYLIHLRARNLSPRTIKATEEYLRLFLHRHDPLTASKRDIEVYLGELADRCKPSTVWTAWRHLKGFYGWLLTEGDIAANHMETVCKPIVPPTEIAVLTADEVPRLLAACKGNKPHDRRDLAIISVMLDTGLRLAEVARLSPDDVGNDNTLRVFGKGRKWRTVALGTAPSLALSRWMRMLPVGTATLWSDTKGPLTTTGIRKVVEHRGRAAGLDIRPHQLHHTIVDNWLRNGGSEVDLARLCGWTSTRMAERYVQHRGDARADTVHRSVGPLDAIS